MANGMESACTTRPARTDRCVATAAAWVILGTSAVHSTSAAQIRTCPLLEPPTATDRWEPVLTRDGPAHVLCAIDDLHGEQSRVGPSGTILADLPQVCSLERQAQPESAALLAEAWGDGACGPAPQPDHPGSAFRLDSPLSGGRGERGGDPLRTDVAWLPDIPVIAFLLTGFAAAFLRRRSVFATE